jgi:acetoacetate decarboxylase
MKLISYGKLKIQEGTLNTEHVNGANLIKYHLHEPMGKTNYRIKIVPTVEMQESQCTEGKWS